MVLRRTYNVMGDLYYGTHFSLVKGKSPANQKKIMSALEQHSEPVRVDIDGKKIHIHLFSDTGEAGQSK